MAVQNYYVEQMALPHLIADGTLESCCRIHYARSLDLFIFSGWIGYVGRKYVRAVSTTKNPAESENYY